jgi:hypothetical protein
MKMVFANNTPQVITLQLGTPSNLVISSALCSSQKGNLGTTVVCSIPNSSIQTEISLSFDGNSVKRSSEYSLFSESFKMPDDVKTFSFLVKLPEGTGLREPTEKSYSPEGALIGFDGRRPIINWVQNGIKSQERFDVSVAFETFTETTSEFPFTLILIIVLIIFSGMGLFYQFYWKSKNVEMIMPVLKKDEKDIFNAILKNGNGVNQKIVVKDSGYSKAKVSKVLNSLKERGLVDLERIGRSNKVHIEKKFQTEKQKQSGNSHKA